MALAIGSVVVERAARSAWSAVTEDPAVREAQERSVFFSRCAEARNAGAAPIHRGEAGYREGLDADGDGVACEPY